MLQKMGWGEGKGLGKKEDGMAAHIKIRKRQEHLGACWRSPSRHCRARPAAVHAAVAACSHACSRVPPPRPPGLLSPPRRATAIGAQADYSGIAPLTSAMTDFNRLLAELHTTAAVGAAVAPPGGGGGSGGVASRTRAHSDASDSHAAAAAAAAPPKQRRVAYGRVLRAKDVGRYSQSDLAAVLAGAAPAAAATRGRDAPPAAGPRKRSRSGSEGADPGLDSAHAPAPPASAAATPADAAVDSESARAAGEAGAESAAARKARKQAKRERREQRERARQQEDG